MARLPAAARSPPARRARESRAIVRGSADGAPPTERVRALAGIWQAHPAMHARGSLRIGTAFGIPVLVHVSWLIAFGLAVTMLSHELGQGRAGAVRAALAAGTALAFFASVVAHELAHSVVALHYGVPVRSITLFVFGGLASLGAEPRRPRDELFVAAAGPLMSLAIGATSLVLGRLAPEPFAGALAWLGRVNIGLAAFNCLPGFPLDGGRMMRAALWARRGDVVSATVTAAKIGRGLAYGFLVLGALTASTVSMASGLWTAFIGWFLLQAAQASILDVTLRDAATGLTAESVMRRDFPTVPAALPVATYVQGIVFPTGERAHLVREGAGTIGVVTLDLALALPRAAWGAASVRDVAAPLSELPRVAPEAPALDVLHAMDAAPLALVVDDGAVVGVVDRARLLAFVETRLQVSRGASSGLAPGDRPRPPVEPVAPRPA